MKVDVQAETHRLNAMSVPALRARYAEVFGEETRSNNNVYLRKRILWQIQANAYGGLSERARQRAMELADESWLRTKAPPPGKFPSPVPGPSVSPRPVPYDTVVAGADQFRIAHSSKKPTPGTVLIREYQGRRIVVSVLAKGFEYENKVYRSLSAVANEVTGGHWNGSLFFGLTGAPKAKAARSEDHA